MDKGPLVNELIEDGGRLIEGLIADGGAVKAACWLRDVEEGRWVLYIATPLVSENGAMRQAYHRVNTVMRRMPQPFWIGSGDVRVINPQEPIALAVQDLHRRYPGPIPVRYREVRFGGVNIDGLYVYPPLAPVQER
jgi:hypothetical protein